VILALFVCGVACEDLAQRVSEEDELMYKTLQYYRHLQRDPFTYVKDEDDDAACTMRHKSIGCFEKNVDAVSLFNKKLNWINYPLDLNELICNCSKEAENGNYKYFALRSDSQQNTWGTCVGINNPDGKASQLCIDKNSKLCSEGKKCTGFYDADYVYKVALAPIDGGFSEWGAWTACSKRCGDGVKNRYRFCNNPPPMYGGARCEGDMEEQMNCRNCPGFKLVAEYKKCNGRCSHSGRFRGGIGPCIEFCFEKSSMIRVGRSPRWVPGGPRWFCCCEEKASNDGSCSQGQIFDENVNLYSLV